MKSKHIGRDKSNSEMARFYSDSFDTKQSVKAGDNMSVKVTDIQDPEYIFVSSQIGEGLITKKQLTDMDGKVTVNPGEQIDAFYVEEKNGERFFTVAPIGAIARIILKRAFENRTELDGKVLKPVKGGFEIEVGDTVAFCPASQMEGEPERNSQMKFIVIEEPGRNIVVSHKQYLESERLRHKEKMISNLEEGSIVQGTVTSLRDFGAFVDIGGGIEGLIPLSELAYKRVGHPSEVLKTGESIRVKVMLVNWKEDRITLSIKELQANPWQGALPFAPGDLLAVTVDSIRPFGVFVKLPDGFHGLIPVSETGTVRGAVLEKEFNRGDELKAIIMEINRETQKISLSLSRAKEQQDRAEFEKYMQASDKGEQKEDISSFGRILMQSLNQKK